MSGILIKKMVLGILRAIEPIDIVLKSKESYTHYLQQHGIDIELTDTDFLKIKTALDFSSAFINLQSLFQQSQESEEENPEILIGLLSVIKTVITEFKILTQGSPDPSLPAPLNNDALWQSLVRETIDRLTFEALHADLPVLAFILLLSGIAEINPIVIPTPNRTPYYQFKMNWEKLGDFINDPLSQIQHTYGWNDVVNGFNYNRFNFYLQFILLRLGFFPRSEDPELTLLDRFYSPDNPLRNDIQILKTPFHMEFSEDFSSFAEVGFQAMPVPEKNDEIGKPMGFTLAPLFKSGFTNSPTDDSGNGMSLQISASLETDAAFRLIILPSGVSLESDTAATSVNAEIALTGQPERPYLLIGASGSHRIELEGYLVSISFKGNISDPEFIFKAGTGQGAAAPKLRFVFQAGESDGFLKTILGEESHSIDLSGMIIWSSKHGFGIEGTAGFSILMPLHLALGPINIDAIVIDASAGTNTDPKIGLGINLSGRLGPLSFVCEQVGAQLKLSSKKDSNEAGLFGNLDFEWGFKPPNGVGLSIDAGLVKGGGYLFFDFEKEEYAGALELTFSGIISLKAIGIITTKMPDGSDGFSLLIIITAEFGTGIQLGFGFVLLGVGGLLGLNRTMKLEPLAEGVRTGGINGIMFPTDIVANAPRIISDLRNYFPPEEGKFLIGPMAKLGWGTPVLISVSLGIIIEIPGNIAILGIIKIALPTEDAPLIVIQINFIGAIEFDKSRLWFLAKLYDSRVLFTTIEGEAGLLVAWGGDANFVVSIGGFHPAFNPPPLPFSSPVRLSFNVLDEPFGRIRVMAYFAVTSNTAQFGAHAELFFGLSSFNINGHIGFDALFQFSPFYFIIELSASFSVEVFSIGCFSIGVRMSLEGPNPYRAKGTGSISLFFFDIDIPFDLTWGESQNTTLPPIRVMPLLKAEFDKLENWKAQLPAGNNILVSLRTIDTAAELVLHPLGTLQVSQRFVPFGLTLDKIGSQKPSDASKFTIDVSGTNGLSKKGDAQESFAMAQFQEMSNADKLSLPSFEKENAGLELSVSGQQVTTGKAVKRIVRYELIVIDTNYKRVVKKFFKFFSGILFNHFLKGNSVARSALSNKTKKQYQPFAEKIKVKQGAYSVADVTNNKAYSAGSASFTSEAQAREFMQQQVKADPNLKNNIHVIPEHEVNTAA